jgi:hypothetical protein
MPWEEQGRQGWGGRGSVGLPPPLPLRRLRGCGTAPHPVTCAPVELDRSMFSRATRSVAGQARSGGAPAQDVFEGSSLPGDPSTISRRLEHGDRLAGAFSMRYRREDPRVPAGSRNLRVEAPSPPHPEAPGTRALPTPAALQTDPFGAVPQHFVPCRIAVPSAPAARPRPPPDAGPDRRARWQIHHPPTPQEGRNVVLL